MGGLDFTVNQNQNQIGRWRDFPPLLRKMEERAGERRCDDDAMPARFEELPSLWPSPRQTGRVNIRDSRIRRILAFQPFGFL